MCIPKDGLIRALFGLPNSCINLPPPPSKSYPLHLHHFTTSASKLLPIIAENDVGAFSGFAKIFPYDPLISNKWFWKQFPFTGNE